MKFVVTETWQYTKTAVVEADSQEAAERMAYECDTDPTRNYDDSCIRVTAKPIPIPNSPISLKSS